MRTGEEYLMSTSLWLPGAGAPPDHQTESPVQVQLDPKKRPLDAVSHGDVEGAFGEIHQEALPPDFELVRGPGRRPVPGPLLDCFSQRPPEAQLHLEPRGANPIAERNGVGGTGELGRKVLEQAVPIAGGARVVTHEMVAPLLDCFRAFLGRV